MVSISQISAISTVLTHLQIYSGWWMWSISEENYNAKFNLEFHKNTNFETKVTGMLIHTKRVLGDKLTGPTAFRLANVRIAKTVTCVVCANTCWSVCVLPSLYGEERNIRQTIEGRKDNWVGHFLHRNCLLKHDVEGKIKGRIEVTRRQGRRRKHLLDGLEEKRG